MKGVVILTKYTDILNDSFEHFYNLKGQAFDIINVAKPDTYEYAEQLVKYISKLSPFVGNMLEFSIVDALNNANNYSDSGKWIRQDPGFPDTLFDGDISPKPGIELKAWFPLATEITARFKETITSFPKESTYVALIAWLPEYIFFGKPKIIDVWIGTAESIALVRDSHYHNPPDYLVLEPEDTSRRTANLQQRNVNGYKFQGNDSELALAEDLVASWGTKGKEYSSSIEYQQKLDELKSKFKYRLDTNFAKIDRIEHTDIESFKSNVLNTKLHGYTISEWSRIISSNPETLKEFLKKIME